MNYSHVGSGASPDAKSRAKAPRRRRRGRIISIALIVIGVTLMAVGGSTIWSEHAEVAEQAAVAKKVTNDDGIVSLDKARDLTGCDAWIEIPGADISLPVMQASKDDPDHWLRHDLNGNWTLAGTVFIDSRNTADSPSAIIYGHHMQGIGGMFSNIHDVYKQDQFDAKIAPGAVWTTASGRHEMKALCSMRVYYTNQLVQEMDFDSTEALQAWARKLVAASSAHVDDTDEVIAGATHVVEAVCCSEMRAHQPWRCVTVFVY